MFFSPAYAQAVGDGGFGGFQSLLPLILIFVVFYFLLIRPQQKKAKVHREMLAALRRGDRIVTSGGLIGKITRVGENELTVEIANDIRVRVARGMVSDVLAKTESVDDEPEVAEVSEPKRARGKRRTRKEKPEPDRLIGEVDFYRILGLDRSAEQDVIAAAYRVQAEKYHPDASKEDAQAVEKFRQIQEAYDVLSDPDDRQKYDEMRHREYLDQKPS